MGTTQEEIPQNHHAYKSHRQCVPMRAHLRVGENLVSECSIERKEEHHAAGDDQPDVHCANELESAIGFRGFRENGDALLGPLLPNRYS